MRKYLFFSFMLLFSLSVAAQKKTIDHSVYDGWQTVGERFISNNGKYVVYTVNPQEGDGTLVIQATDNSYKKEIPRGYGAAITEDSRFVVFKIRPLFKDTRDARIKKKRPDDMPKDSLAIVEAGKDSVLKIPRVKSFKTPEKGDGLWMAYLQEKSLPEPAKPGAQPDSLTRLNKLLRMADSLSHIADSLRNKANEAKEKGLLVLQPVKKENRPAAKAPSDPVEEGTDLVLYNLYTGEKKIYKLVNDYYFSKKGNVLLVKSTASNTDTLTKATVAWISLPDGKSNTVMSVFNDARSFTFDEEGTQLAFVAERDSVTKALRKFFKLWFYKPGMDSARLRADRNSTGVAKGLTVSENVSPVFSKDGKKLFFGLAPVRKPKDTALVDFETARLDIWHFNDDYLQPQQLVQANLELRKGFTSVVNDDGKVIQLGTDSTDNIILVDEGNSDYVLATSSKGNRTQSQWMGFPLQKAYIISTTDGSRKLIRDKHRGQFTISPKGKYVIWYDIKTRNYFTYSVADGITRNVTQKIKVPLYNDEDDHPDDPPSLGSAGWEEDDATVLINDFYDIWQVDPAAIKDPVNVTDGYGRKNRIIFRYLRGDRDARFINHGEQLYLTAFNRTTKYDGFSTKKLGISGDPVMLNTGPYVQNFPVKAKNASVYMFVKMTTQEPQNVFTTADFKSLTQMSAINPQQKEYNWVTSELIKWKMFDGKEAEGLLYKPENFDPKKKYPVIFYFYEQDADDLYSYRQPAPSASTINIAWFVSNGYLVCDPNIYYKNGEPGESAYNSVGSAARYLSKMPWVDSTKMAIQGQSWGGYQVAYLVTRTKMFAAAWAGAPVANMTSAYGGIRWGTGLNRQFQYERSQSRIGATLWQKPDLYIKNSPLFKADKVVTPLAIVHNDADGSVPWYQGIEYFTALRRLGKKVWMLEYNGEDHNLVERRNRKDLSIRLGQFFDHFLKGAPAPRWMTEGVPAIDKGIEWGTEIGEQKGF